MEVYRNISLKSRNTFGMDVKAACLVEYSSVGELSGIFGNPSFPRPFLHIGGGSNLLFTKDFPGTVLHSKIDFIEIVGNNEDSEVPGEEDAVSRVSEEIQVRAGSGTSWDGFCSWAAGKGLWGAENLSLIPGEVGAAAVQNIGAYGTEAKDIIRSVECYDVQQDRPVCFDEPACAYSYRDSFFKNVGKGQYIVTAVVFALRRDYSPKLDYAHLREAALKEYGSETLLKEALTPADVRNLITAVRRSKLPDPEEIGSAGSFFRNPSVTEEAYSRIVSIAAAEGWGEVPHFPSGGLVKIPAAWLIDKCGWKGFSSGNAGVYGKQPLVIVNLSGNASPEEILDLESRIAESVSKRFGVALVPEVEHI